MGQASVALLADGEELATVLSPVRRLILEAVREPDSATGVAGRLGLSRQKVNYHLRILERAGLVELIEERQRRGCTERVLRASARSYIANPNATGLVEDGDAERDRFATEALIGAAARTVRDVSTLRAGADRVGKKLATLTIEGEVRLGSPADLSAFGEEVAAAVVQIADRYAARAPRGRRFRFMTGVHPRGKP